MKKTRIIAPALAIIAFSTAASIAGSVAWFTASRQVTINAGNYTVVKTSSDLAVTLANGVGTTAVQDSKTIQFTGLLTHGSFSHTTNTVYTPNGEGKALEKSTLLTADNFATEMEVTTIDTKKVYTAVTFGITFTMNFGAGDSDKGLYLNNTAGQSAFTVANSATPVTAKGFRMAFVPGTPTTGGSTNVARVYADLQETAKCKYVTGAETFSTGVTYGENELVDVNYNAALPTSETARATAIARPDYLGTFKAPAADASPLVSLPFTVVCWFEGTDENIVNRNDASEYQTVLTKLVFDAVDLKAA